MTYTRTSLLAALAALAVAGCGGTQTPSTPTDGPIVEDPGPVHVHGLGVNPADRALMLATHTGLFRVPEGATTGSDAERLADRYQDTMGFKVVGPDRFIGSGHPDGRDGLPPLLGLIESDDGGESWKPISLLGEADFHVLEAAGERIYGFDSSGGRLMTSADGGKTWEEAKLPEALFGIGIDPEDPEHLLAAGEGGLHGSTDAGKTWRSVSGETGLFEWPADGDPLLLGLDGSVRSSDDGGETWSVVGSVSGSPVAFEAAAPDELYVALDNGSIQQSTNGGADWNLRFSP